MVRVTPCLMFDGNAAEALAHHLKAFLFPRTWVAVGDNFYPKKPSELLENT